MLTSRFSAADGRSPETMLAIASIDALSAALSSPLWLVVALPSVTPVPVDDVTSIDVEVLLVAPRLVLGNDAESDTATQSADGDASASRPQTEMLPTGC